MLCVVMPDMAYEIFTYFYWQSSCTILMYIYVTVVTLVGMPFPPTAATASPPSTPPSALYPLRHMVIHSALNPLRQVVVQKSAILGLPRAHSLSGPRFNGGTPLPATPILPFLPATTAAEMMLYRRHSSLVEVCSHLARDDFDNW